MSKYVGLMEKLDTMGIGVMKAFGNSMLPIIKSGSTLTFIVEKEYNVGDIVFCKVKGRYIDAHKIIQKCDKRGYLIANNHGHQNGWTKKVFGRVIQIESPDKTFRYF